MDRYRRSPSQVMQPRKKPDVPLYSRARGGRSASAGGLYLPPGGGSDGLSEGVSDGLGDSLGEALAEGLVDGELDGDGSSSLNRFRGPTATAPITMIEMIA